MHYVRSDRVDRVPAVPGFGPKAVQLAMDAVFKHVGLTAGAQPEVIGLKEAAAIAHVHPGTIKRWLAEGRFRRCARRGRPILFLRDKFIIELMRGDR